MNREKIVGTVERLQGEAESRRKELLDANSLIVQVLNRNEEGIRLLGEIIDEIKTKE